MLYESRATQRAGQTETQVEACRGCSAKGAGWPRPRAVRASQRYRFGRTRAADRCQEQGRGRYPLEGRRGPGSHPDGDGRSPERRRSTREARGDEYDRSHRRERLSKPDERAPHRLLRRRRRPARRGVETIGRRDQTLYRRPLPSEAILPSAGLGRWSWPSTLSVSIPIVPLVTNLELRMPSAPAHRDAVTSAQTALRDLPLYRQV